MATFLARLGELGWAEGRTIAIEYRWAEGRSDRYADIAAEFVRLKVDVIFTYGTLQVIAAKQATSIIPIVFALVGDPVGAGLVASLARPRKRYRPLPADDRHCHQTDRIVARGRIRPPSVGDSCQCRQSRWPAGDG
jgi:hypothetical protein